MIFGRFHSLFSGAQTFAGLGKQEKALELIAEAEKLHPEHAPLLIHKAMALSDLGRFDEAVEVAAKAAQLGESNPAVHVFRAMVLSDAGKTDEARDASRNALALDPLNNLAKALSVYINLLEDKSGAAADLLDLSIPDHSGIVSRLAEVLEGKVLKDRIGEGKAAPELKRAKKAARKKKNSCAFSTLPMTTAEASLARGKRLLWNESFEKAVEPLGIASALTAAQHGCALFLANRRAEAEDSLRSAVQGVRKGNIPPTDEALDAMECYAELLWDKGRIADAMGVLQAVVELTGTSSPGASYFLGVVEMLSGNRREGRRAIAEVMSADPNQPLKRLQYLASQIK